MRLHEASISSSSRGFSPTGRKRSSETASTSSSKRHKGDEDTDSDSAMGIVAFDPASLVRSREGTIKVPKPIQKYLSKHLKQCLTKEQREALFKEHPRPDLEVTLAPKVDKYISDFLGKKLPKEQDTELMKVQTAVLACLRPLTSAWQELLEQGLEQDTDMTVPAKDVLALIQRSVCLIGNASEYISQTRRAKILESIDKTWGKFGTDEYRSSDTLFGQEFQSSLTDKVEKDVALSKAVSIMKRNQRGKEQPSSSSRKEGQSYTRFFRGGPPARYGGRQGKSSYPYTPHTFQPREREPGRGRRPFNYSRSQRYHEPRLPQTDPNQQAQRKF